jgi:hypothetical protein
LLALGEALPEAEGVAETEEAGAELEGGLSEMF